MHKYNPPNVVFDIILLYQTRLSFPDYDRFNNDFWFSRIDSVCGNSCTDSCTDALSKWIVGTKNEGMRIPMIHSLGKGGFGHVYHGRLHGNEIAAKMINITNKILVEEDKRLSNNFFNSFIGLQAEAINQSGLKHKNVLPVLEYWIQCYKLTTMAVVIATPLCQKNLREWLETPPFQFIQIRDFFFGVILGLHYLATKDFVHGDIKLSNILIDENLIAVIADFGLEGATSVYAAPETLDKKPVLMKTDIHGLGIRFILS